MDQALSKLMKTRTQMFYMLEKDHELYGRDGKEMKNVNVLL